jgi:hypothetical protein
MTHALLVEPTAGAAGAKMVGMAKEKKKKKQLS